MISREMRVFFGFIIVCFIVLVSGIVIFAITSLLPVPVVILDPLSPGEAPTNYSVQTIEAGNLLLNATAEYSGAIPHQPPINFDMRLAINITNVGNNDVEDFRAWKASVFYSDSELFYTFSLSPDGNSTIAAGERITLYFNNVGGRKLYASFWPFDEIYARVLITFDVDREVILTTPLAFGDFAIE
jgi:hypothetical protein